jgi:hypothetical protein
MNPDLDGTIRTTCGLLAQVGCCGDGASVPSIHEVRTLTVVLEYGVVVFLDATVSARSEPDCPDQIWRVRLHIRHAIVLEWQ